jgi:hypothetical protein
MPCPSHALHLTTDDEEQKIMKLLSINFFKSLVTAYLRNPRTPLSTQLSNTLS